MSLNFGILCHYPHPLLTVATFLRLYHASPIPPMFSYFLLQAVGCVVVTSPSSENAYMSISTRCQFFPHLFLSSGVKISCPPPCYFSPVGSCFPCHSRAAPLDASVACLYRQFIHQFLPHPVQASFFPLCLSTTALRNPRFRCLVGTSFAPPADLLI